MAITVKQLVAWLTCHEKAQLVSAGVLDSDPARDFLRRIKAMIPKAIAKGKDRALAVMYDLFNQFPFEAFELSEEAKEIYDVYLIQTERLIRYFFNSGYSLVSSEPTFYSVKVPGLDTDEVSGRIDIVARNPEGVKEYITFDVTHKNSYKHKARKACNKPENAPELVLPAVALQDAEARYSVWYLRGGEDKKGVYPEFEVKDGANIAWTEFKDISVARSSLDMLIENHPEERKCDSCAYAKVCKPYPDTAPASEKKDTAAASASGSAPAVTLTEEQKAVVDFRKGALCVVAIPGAGKTKTLISRMCKLVNDGVDISNILFLTFTNKACGEIAERVSAVFGEDALTDANIKTFNGFGYDILKANEKLIGRPVQLAREATRRSMIRTVILKSPRMTDVNMTVLDGNFGLVKRMDDWIQQFEMHQCSEERFRADNPNVDFEGFFRIYEAYKEEFRLNGYINYNDQIKMVVDLFEENPELAAKYSRIYEYVMVDEFQDVNFEQVQLLQLLCSHGNIVCVGDDDQAIYSFRGGSNEYMINFPSYFKGGKTVALSKNFRSNDKIVKTAEICIAHNGARLKKTLKPNFTARLKPMLLDAPNNQEIAEKYLRPMITAYGARNVAVIARRNARLSDIRTALDEAGIISTNPKDYLRADRSFQLLYDLMAIYLYGPSQKTEAFTRLYSSFVTTDKVVAGYDESFYAALVRCGILTPLINSVAAKKQYESKEGKAGEFGRNVLKTFELFDYSSDAKECLESAITLWYPDADYNMLLAADVLSQQFEESGTRSVSAMFAMMDAMVRYADETRISYDYGEAVNLLTAHDSKGKEFAGVIVLDADTFLDSDEEGRRVLYVALTRAKHTLVITSSGNVSNHLIYDELGDSVTVAV